MIGQNIKMLREGKSWSQEQLSKELHSLTGRRITQQSIAQIENGQTNNPRYLEDFAKVFGVTESHIRFGEADATDLQVDERSEFSRRLNEALDNIGFPAKGKGRQMELGKLFGISQHAARKWLEGEAIPHTKRLPDIADKLKVNAEWLLSGRDGGDELSNKEMAQELLKELKIISQRQSAIEKTMSRLYHQVSAIQIGQVEVEQKLDELLGSVVKHK
ncbi:MULTISPECIES: helix-turn-helix domain-containing protein [unclassified Endozoicomonas]|uniref:helix-turn-helix domain-containing protein n=1 Tax=unclassified Endozoicomonas TaxID=2644528 RepID=UPI003BB74D61